jgi:biotin transporter BioY
VKSTDNRLRVIGAGSGTTETIVQEANGAGLVPIVATVLTAAQSGMEVFLGPTAGFQITLPAAAAGLWFRFTVRDNFATSNYTIVTPGLLDIIEGSAMVVSTIVPAIAEDTISFVASAELKGDFAEVWSDGTTWFVHGHAQTSGAITFTTAG